MNGFYMIEIIKKDNQILTMEYIIKKSDENILQILKITSFAEQVIKRAYAQAIL